MSKAKVILKPNNPKQELALSCPVWELLMSGNRGSGKSLILLMDFLQHVGQGFRESWRGVIFRRTYVDLTDLIATCQKWIPRIFPKARYNATSHIWKFPDGEELLMRYLKTSADYSGIHGWQLPFCSWEELTTWATDELYMKAMSINRSSHKGIPLKYRATTNPGGPGAAWVKRRFVSPAPEGSIIVDAKTQLQRVHLALHLADNEDLLSADPTYVEKLIMLTGGDENLRKAWVEGSWETSNVGAALYDVWDYDKHVLPPFNIPDSWSVNRTYDWGLSKPWACAWFAEANGEQPEGLDFTIPKGSIFCISEIYGSNGEPNEGDRTAPDEHARRILARDRELFGMYGARVYPGPADNMIWDVQQGRSIAASMQDMGCSWTRSNKGPGSRATGLTLIRQMLSASVTKAPERPHLYFFEGATPHMVRTLPELQWDDKAKDDIDSDSDDHLYDVLRYRVLAKAFKAQVTSTVGL